MQVGDSYNPRRLFRGIFIPEALARMSRERLSPGAKLAFGWLCWLTDDETGECSPSADTLAASLGVSERQAREYLTQLEREGFIRQSRRGPETNSFEFSWHDVLESCVRKDRKKGSDQRPEENPEKTGTKLPISLRDKEVLENVPEDSPIIPMPASPAEDPKIIGIEEFYHAWNRHPGFRKLQRSLHDWISGRLAELQLTLGEAADSMRGYHQSEFGKREQYPVRGFLKSPRSYIGPSNATDEAGAVPPPSEGPSGQVAPSGSPQSAKQRIDRVAMWNQLVPAMPVTWDWKRSNVDGLRMAELDDMFVERFHEICRRAQKIHIARPNDSKYLTFNWILKREGRTGPWNWFKLLQDFEWMETPDKRSGAREGWKPGMLPISDEDEAAYAAWRKERKAAGLHTDSDLAAEEEANAGK